MSDDRALLEKAKEKFTPYYVKEFLIFNFKFAAEKVVNGQIEEYLKLIPYVGEYLPILRDYVNGLRETLNKLDPNDAKGWFKKGNLSYDNEQYQEAIDCFKKALSADPNYQKAWKKLGDSFVVFGYTTKALESYDKALSLNRNDYETWNNRGNLFFLLGGVGNFERAKENFEKALKIKSDFYLAHYNYGHVLYRLKSYREAIVHFKAASLSEMLDIKAIALNGCGDTFAKLDDYDRAIVDYNEALKLRRDFYQVWFNRGNVLADKGNLEEALASYENALEYKKDSFEIWHHHGKILFDLKRYEEALNSFKKALEIEPDFLPASTGEIQTLTKLGRNKEARDASIKRIFKK